MICYANKKGELSLEALLGIILSSIGLILLVTFSTSLFSSGTPNQEISQDTINSLGNFISHGQESIYEGVGECYLTFKTNQLTNYQKDVNDESNYFFVVTSDYIGTVLFSHRNSFKNQEEEGFQYIENKKEFENPITLKEDETDSGNFIQREVSAGYWGMSDVELQLSDTNLEYFLLVPDFTNQKAYEVVIPTSRDNDASQGRNSVNQRNIDRNIDSSYLAFNPITTELFAPKNKVSQSFVNNKLCLEKKRQIELKNEMGLEDMYDLNYQEFKFTFEITPQSEYGFEWNRGPICKKNGNSIPCSEPLNSNSYNYEEFLDAIQDYMRNLDGDVSLGISEIIPIKEYFNREDSAFRDLFLQSNEITTQNYFEENSDQIKSEFEQYYYVENCNLFTSDNDCPGMIYKNNKLYQIKPQISDNNFVSFNHNFITGYKTQDDEYVYFFNNEKINIETEEIKDMDDNRREVYNVEFSFQDENYEIYLSPNQLRNIKSRAFDISNTFILKNDFQMYDYFGIPRSGDHYLTSDNSTIYLKDSYDIETTNGKIEPEEVYIFNNNELLFYNEDIDEDTYVKFNEDLIQSFDEFEENSYYYFSKEINFRQKQFYNNENNEKIGYCFTLTPFDYSQSVFPTLYPQGEVEICISEEQFLEIQEENDDE